VPDKLKITYLLASDWKREGYKLSLLFVSADCIFNIRGFTRVVKVMRIKK
jgi:hypothetical protein